MHAHMHKHTYFILDSVVGRVEYICGCLHVIGDK